MTDQQPETEVDEPAGPPRWVTGIVVAVMILLFVVLHLIIGGVGPHGHSRHSLGHASSTSVDRGAPQ